MGYPKRYIFDTLYGKLSFPQFIWDLFEAPELQRLRDIRLCNINSLCLTGGANINRFEHSLGTCFLASECIKHWPLNVPIIKDDTRHLLIAALLHDIGNGAFGHSVEYVRQFEPETSLTAIARHTRSSNDDFFRSRLEHVYANFPGSISKSISSGTDLKAIQNIVSGKARLSKLINGDMDLDNIDNVFRLAYHIGLTRHHETPLNLARSIHVRNGLLVVKSDSIPLVEDWFRVRKLLYKFLLENPDEFSAKCMLTESIELADFKLHRRWTDSELIHQLTEAAPVKYKVFAPLRHSDNSGISREHCKYVCDAVLSHNDSHKRVPSESTHARISDPVAVDDTRYKLWKCQDRYLPAKEYLRAYEPSVTASRLMRGMLYGCLGIYSTTHTVHYQLFQTPNSRREIDEYISYNINLLKLEQMSGVIVSTHAILDVKKTERQIQFHDDKGHLHTIGRSSNRLLIGVFLRNEHLSMRRILSERIDLAGPRLAALSTLKTVLGDDGVQSLKLFSEAELAKGSYEHTH